LAQEIEFRLERSFEAQAVSDAVYPLVARISDQIGELALFVISHNDPDHLNQLMRLLDTDGLRATIESTRPPVDGMVKVPDADARPAKLPRSPDSAAGLKGSSRSQRDRSQEVTTGELVDELKRRLRKLAGDEAAYEFGRGLEKEGWKGKGER
jgi:hypothetical protein